MQDKIVILGTGGTIAGTAERPDDAIGYTAAQICIGALIAAVPALSQQPIECEQVAQIDSKDLSFDVWQRLAQRCAAQFARADVRGVVVTHGSDTLEETAYLLHRVLAPVKPLVLTAAMRPATSVDADGPRNLADAVAVARDAAAHGVLVAMAGRVWAGWELRKQHSTRLDAFDAGDDGPLAVIEPGGLVWQRDAPPGEPLGLARIARDPAQWPRVEIVLNHAGADGRVVDALLAQGVHGIVVAGTGNGTLHHALDAALRRAQAGGVRVLRASRCAAGGVVVDAEASDALSAAGPLSAVQARVELLLLLLDRSG